ncbi:S66 peptidase family protein [Baaleninema simplex]|uniref:S66 peptidase family protein n=1 Tax=Baaleninema simplex TaxID=2862350 RepID=UPI00034D333A|nr:LD-carboxypeptidase [Baaleninema simplex]
MAIARNPMSLSIQLPPPLQPGDLLVSIAPSGCVRDKNAFEAGVNLWRSQGYRVEISGIDDRHGYLAGTDAQRRDRLSRALSDPEVKGILYARGGYGGARLLEHWDWNAATTPKWSIGFSDITALLWSWAKQGISGVHGPLLATLAQEPQSSQNRLFDWVSGGAIAPLTGRGWGGGTAIGRLFPGNLAVATHLIGTPHEPDLTGAILAFEDIGEAPYRIDRLLTHWRMSGRFDNIAGIALGRFSRSDVAVPGFTAEEVLHDRLSDLGVPVVSDLPFGHDGINCALPVGVVAELDGDRGSLAICPR